MKKLRYLLLFMVFASAITQAYAQPGITIQVKNQRIIGSNFYFDVYLQRSTGASVKNVHLGNADFALIFDSVHFSSPAITLQSGTTVFKNQSGTAAASYAISPAIIASGPSVNRIVISVQPPTFSGGSGYNANIATINGDTTHKLGTFKISGVTANLTNPGLAWKTSGTGFITKIYSIDSSTLKSVKVTNLNAVDPALDTEPSAHVTNFAVSDYSDSTTSLSWTVVSGANTIILAKKTATAGSASPVDGISYPSDSNNFAAGNTYNVGNEEIYVVYNGSDSSVTVGNLEAGTEYIYYAYTYTGSNGVSENYYTGETVPSVTQKTMEGEPETSPTDIVFGTTTKNSISLSWTAGSGTNTIVIAHEASDVVNDPSDKTYYTSNGSFSDTSNSTTGTGDIVVYAGSGTSVNVTGLENNTRYYFKAYSYNGDSATSNFRTASPATGNQKTIDDAPTIAASNFSITAQTASAITMAFTKGNGTSYIVVAREGSAVSATPSDASTYAVNDTLSSGQTVVYTSSNGVDEHDTVTISGLDQNKTYYFAVYDFNGDNGGETYLTTAGTISDNTYLKLAAKVYLEGAYDDNSDAMTTNINSILPLSQPYSGFGYGTVESVASIPSASVVDWVYVELREAGSAAAADTSTIKARKAGFLLSNGDIVDLDGTSPLVMPISESGSFYTVIFHRNHLPVMSSATISYSNDSTKYEYNFTGSSSAAYTNGSQNVIGSASSADVYGMISGMVENTNNSQRSEIDAGDRTNVWNDRTAVGGTYETSDCTLDGLVDSDDRTFIDNNTGKTNNLPH